MNKWQKEVQESLLKSESEVVKALERQYKNALKEINSKISAFEQSISDLNDAIDSAADMQELQRLRSVKQSKVYQKQYQEALRGQVSSILDKMHSDQFTTIDAYLKGCYDTSYIGTMYDVSRQGLPIIQPINQAAVTKAILTDSKVQGGYYKALGVNVTKLKKAITAEISRGIASGMRYSDIARNIDSVAKTGFNNAYRIARTEGHRITQSAAYDAQMAIAEKGIEILRQWDSVLDGRTRPSHRLLDGQIVGVNEDFTYNGKKVQKPGSFGLPEEDINCRCIVTTRIPEDLDEEELETLKKRAEFFGIDKSDSFKDFAEKYLKAVAKSENDYKKPYEESEDEQYKSLLSSVMRYGNIDYKPVEMRGTDFDVDSVVSAVGGGDRTRGSCASLGLAYIGQRQGWNVIDYRDGNSREFFSRSGNLKTISMFDGIKAFRPSDVKGKTTITVANNLLHLCEEGKEYYLCVGRHASIVRKIVEDITSKETGEITGTMERFQYLELQSAKNSGWQYFNGNTKYTLQHRFGCGNDHWFSNDFMIDLEESNFDTPEFRSILGFINTEEDKQRKGTSGTIK